MVSNAGALLTGGNNQITFNIGETVIPTFSAGSSVLTQGFEQPGEALRPGTVATTVCAGSSISVTIYCHRHWRWQHLYGTAGDATRQFCSTR
ncbi:MAG: hypothetical protein IPN94_14780 [Sphingobacteriales bacterium]|nr:hypothetical protein [Sphingobacteriales bacterium]